MEKIKFKDLSFWLKLAIVMGFIKAIELAIAFLTGFMYGFFN